MAAQAPRIIVLGAAGRLGSAAANAFRAAGWEVTGLIRPGTAHRAPQGINLIQTNDRAVLVKEARGTDVVLHALNVAYPEWHRHLLPLTYSAIDAAESAGATLMFPGNVYNFGTGMPEVLDESTPQEPATRKGVLRVEAEDRMREAAERGVRVVILRAGDFFGAGRGSWFDLVVVKDIAKGRVMFPGPPDVLHAWAYVPDYVDTLVKLAQIRERLSMFEVFGFPGHAVTGREFVEAIGKAVPQNIQVKPVSWFMINTIGKLTAMGRELSELQYLWRVPHRIDGARLRSLLGEIPHTPLDQAMKDALRELGEMPT
jgi:nucleoside-diphosphate-sugar epimerase